MNRVYLLLKMAVLLLLPYTQLVAQQQTDNSRLDNYFNEAYRQYPGLPKGILEAMAYSATHMTNLQPHEDNCMGMPERFGIFGLVENGKGYFKNNLVEVSKLSNISTAQFKNDVRLQILATAKFLSREAGSRKVAAGVESFATVLESISEIPDDGSAVNAYARSLYTYDVYDNLQKGFTAATLTRAPANVQLEKIYPAKTLRALKATGVQIDYARDKVISPDNVLDQSAAIDGVSVLSTDYGPAIFSAAHANNYTVGRGGVAVTNVTIHTAQGSYAGTISWFKNSTAIVSSHYVIRSSDGQVTQMVREKDKAYHVLNHNSYTIGIEHEGYIADAKWYTTSMYSSSAALVRNICTKYGISKAACFKGAATSGTNYQPKTVRIKGHQHYDGNTHTDPGINWNWKKYAALINPATVAATKMAITVRDQETGFAVANTAVTVTGPDGTTTRIQTDENGQTSFDADKGKYTFSFSANGYDQIETSFEGGDETNIAADISMDRISSSMRIASDDEAIRQVVAANNMILSGYVRSAVTNAPIAGATVTAGGRATIFDRNGFFTLTIPVPVTAVTETVAPGVTTLRITRTGFKPYVLNNIRLIADKITVKVGLTPLTSASDDQRVATTEEVETYTHGMFDRTAADEAQRTSEYLRIADKDAESAVTAAAIAVPTSIRVGTSCSCTTCSAVKVMSLEAYVQSGLDNEWISSWKAASLQAGAVAYRSYGAYYVKHPVKSNFDIASTTCNQAWGSETATSTINAAKATAGVVLIKSGAIFRSEYSAENNNAGCGNGYSGTGSAWPCISDARCAGRTTNGHGRGMCQWGSSFWASDKTYTWILNHYYNPGGVTVQAAATVAATLAKTEAPKETAIVPTGKLTLFPNPVSGDVVKVGYTLSASARSAIVLLSDNTGKVLQRKPVQLIHGYNQFTLDISALKNGIYIVTIKPDLSVISESKKLVVAK
ncbi:SpoIID/LytB domain protein/Por secretion system C-terminal sorting domain-containing protein [Chitinophaga sp. YR573]|uniref:N-acetylmuramoyl-L-alanine amidase n=1 Tax=Chitinophaga sp. YR573 TaxID=1881040 RepID=UPI0008D629F0|nr:N-acetylmuramoyl-L-alanine amidase [Chitinophaga sp. YR573]SEW45783.1 SpoIID/LytB domain protein/Por secretion system C-terminal sorting domain-containing protein [Chitinophaga sp. YR573]